MSLNFLAIIGQHPYYLRPRIRFSPDVIGELKGKSVRNLAIPTLPPQR